MANSSGSAAPNSGREGRRTGFDWRALRGDLRGAVPDATLALVITALIYWLLYVRVANGTSSTIKVMPMLADADEFWMYWMCQAFGWSAMLWAYVTVIFGLLRSGPRPGGSWLSAARLEKWHRTTSLTTIGLMFMHALFFFADQVRSNQDQWSLGRSVWTAFVDVFVPGGYATGTGRVAIFVGLLALYLAIPLGFAFYLRNRTGSRVWLALHRFAIVVYILSIWHTLLYTTQGWFDGPFRAMLWILQIPLAVLLLIRLMAPARRSERLRRSGPRRRDVALPIGARVFGRILVAAAVLALVAVVVTGVDGGRSPKDGPLEPWPEKWVVWVGLALFLLAVVGTVIRVRRRSAAPTRAATADESHAVRVAIDQKPADMVLEATGDGQLPAVERGIAQGGQPFVRGDLEGDEVAGGAGDDDVG